MAEPDPLADFLKRQATSQPAIRSAPPSPRTSRDGRLLGRSDDIYHATGLSVVRPSQFIGQLDALQREGEYQRQAVAGTRRVTRERVVLPDGSLISTIALQGERHNELRGVFHRHLADPINCECHKVMDGEETLAVYVVERRTEGVCVPIVRICARRKPGTIARAVLTGLVRASVHQGVNHLLISDPKLSLVVADACSSLGFLKVRDGWLKLVLSGWLKFDELSSRLHYDDPAVELLVSTFDDARKSAKVASLVEHVLWPVKVSDSALPSFIVPIRPQFAEHLFDEQLASSSLFGADVDLALNPESAYYRSAKPAILTCPSRVLWYVSEHKSFAGSKTIRACSRLVELRVDLPSALHKRFRRLGVFDWKDVLSTAHGDTNRKIMGFRFDDTELMPSIRFSEFQRILRSNGVRSNLQSPTAIPASAFGEIYAIAFDSSEVRGRDHRGHEDRRTSTKEAAS